MDDPAEVTLDEDWEHFGQPGAVRVSGACGCCGRRHTWEYTPAKARALAEFLAAQADAVEKGTPEHLGYALIKSEEGAERPEFCVHGPDPVETDYAYAYDAWKDSVADASPGTRYFLCKLVPVDPVEPDGDLEDRLPFDWARTERKVAEGRLSGVWLEIAMATTQVRRRLGIDGDMEAARGILHPFIAAEGSPFDKADRRLDYFCAACGCISSLIAHQVEGRTG